jgi:hypothetical protein
MEGRWRARERVWMRWKECWRLMGSCGSRWSSFASMRNENSKRKKENEGEREAFSRLSERAELSRVGTS